VALGLHASALGRSLVHCTAADGSARLEWGCPKDEAGHCAASCEGDDLEGATPSFHGDSERCDDAPLSVSATVTARPRGERTVQDVVPAPTVLPALHAALPEPPVAAAAARDGRATGPPPPLRLLRTVIILV
jgi:hypothetical protein